MSLDKLIKDFPFQFRGKEKIEALCNALDRQYAELFDVFSSVKLDTSIDNAVGKQLDYIGDVVGLTRAEGALLCGNEIYFEVLDDDRYRSYLKYKAYKNANNCTYEDVINQLKTILGEDGFLYSEDINYPATILITVNRNKEGAVSLVSIPTVSPAGVSVLYSDKIAKTITVGYEMKEQLENIKATVSISVDEIAIARSIDMFCGTFYCGTRP